MKFTFIWVGKTRNKNFKALQDEYLQRLSHFVRCDVVELKDVQAVNARETEGKRILEKLNHTTLVCLLDVLGEAMSSKQLSAMVDNWQVTGKKEIAFVIGGVEGVSAEVAERADIRVSLSFLTFTHEMARVVLLEQLYRAYTIIKGFPYQR